MPLCKVISKPLPYDNKVIQVGETFNCSDRFVRVLEILKRVEKQNAPLSVVKETPPETTQTTAPRRRGRPRKQQNYTTRDMQSENN